MDGLYKFTATLVFMLMCLSASAPKRGLVDEKIVRLEMDIEMLEWAIKNNPPRQTHNLRPIYNAKTLQLQTLIEKEGHIR